MELQESYPDFQRAGTAVFGISYDSVETLGKFAQKHGIAYSLLSDEGSRVIRALGLYNQYTVGQHTALGIELKDYHDGIAYPGTFALDADGIVVRRHLEQHYRKRPSAAGWAETALGIQSTRPSVRARAETEQLAVEAWIGQPTYRPNQILWLNFALQVAPGLHVYGRPIPDDYVPLTVEVDPLDSLEVGELELPQPTPYRMPGLDETFHVYQGQVRGSLQFVLAQNLGPVNLSLRLRYQACSEVDCYPPRECVLSLPLEGLERVRD